MQFAHTRACSFEYPQSVAAVSDQRDQAIDPSGKALDEKSPCAAHATLHGPGLAAHDFGCRFMRQALCAHEQHCLAQKIGQLDDPRPERPEVRTMLLCNRSDRHSTGWRWPS